MPQTIQWTLLPDGSAGGKFRFSVFVTPRLSGASTLSGFPDWTNWPQIAATLQPRVTIGTQTFSDAAIVRRTTPGLLTAQEASQWWQTLFPPSTPVANGAPEKFGNLPIVSYPLGSIATGMQGLYGAAGVAQLAGGFTLQQSAALAVGVGLTGNSKLRLAGLAGRMDPALGAPVSSARSAAGGTQFAGDLALMRFFFGGGQQTAATKPGPARPAHPGLKMGGDEPDFHQRISLLGDYPIVLRSLGLVLDFELTGAPAITTDTRISVEMTGNFKATSVSPRTVTGKNYRAVPRAVMQAEPDKTAPELSPEGFFNLEDDAWSVVEFDAEGGVFKLDSYLQNALSATVYNAPDTPKSAPMPSLRAAGLALCRLNRGAVLAKALDVASQNADSTQPPVLYADDLVQGVRVDVREAPVAGFEAANLVTQGEIGKLNVMPDAKNSQPISGLQRFQPSVGSLQAPTRTKRLPLGRQNAGNLGGTIGNRGVVNRGVSAGGGARTPIIAPKRSQSLAPAKQPILAPKPGGTSVGLGGAMGAKIPGMTKVGPWQSLCRRSGSYTLGGKTLEWKDEGWISPAFAQKNYEGGTALGVSEAIFRWNDWSLVVAQPEPPKLPASPKPNPGALSPALPLPKPWQLESEFGLDGSLLPLRFGRTYQFRARAVDLAGNGPGYEDAGGQASAASQGFYGRFEPVSSPVLVPTRDLDEKLAPGASFVPLKASAGESNDRLVIRSDYAIAPTMNSSRHVMPPRADFAVALAHGVFDDATGKPDRAASPLIARLGATVPAIVPGAKAPVTYLVDPLAKSAILLSELLLDLNIVQKTSPWLEIPFFTDVPANAKAWHWRLSSVPDGQKPTVITEDMGALSVFAIGLSPGQMVKFRIACAFDDDDLELMGQWRWTKAFLKALKMSATDEKNWVELLRILAANGLHDSFTPGRTITLVHAVQRPLIAPKFVKLEAGRVGGDTDCALRGILNCDAKTTAKVDVVAQWSEPVDDGVSPAPDKTRVAKNAVACEMTLYFEPQSDPCSPHNDVPLAPATRNLIVHQETPPGGNSKNVAKAATIGSYSPAKKQFDFSGGLAALRDSFRTQRHEFGDTKYRRVEYHAVATSRFREYFVGVKSDSSRVFPTSGFTRGDGAERQFVTLDIPSTAPPQAPKVHSVIPTFRWTRGKDTSKRTGGLRIYLERPWFSSGDGELLAVVLSGPEALPSFTQAYTTLWGRDPIQPIAGTGDGALTVANFPRKVATKGETAGIYLSEDTSSRVNIAPHAVAFDAERNQWFCDVDIDLPDNAYFPFVRLALARYQPISADGVSLSNVVRAEFAQITPDRSVTLVRAANRTQVTVRVAGTIPRENVIALRLEKKTGTGDLSWLPVGEPVTMSTELDRSRKGTLTGEDATRNQQYRVVIREYEVWRNGTDEPTQRLVYAENIEL